MIQSAATVLRKAPSSFDARRKALATTKSWNASMAAEVTVLDCPCLSCVNAGATRIEVQELLCKCVPENGQENATELSKTILISKRSISNAYRKLAADSNAIYFDSPLKKWNMFILKVLLSSVRLFLFFVFVFISLFLLPRTQSCHLTTLLYFF